MNEPPEHLPVVRQWVQRAEEDFVAARHLLALGDQAPLGAVCFHAQQCVEKYLKALLTLNADSFPRTHDLTDLLARLSDYISLAIDPVEIALLNRYSVETRYPGNWEPIAFAEGEEAVQTMEKTRQTIRHALPQEMLPEQD